MLVICASVVHIRTWDIELSSTSFKNSTLLINNAQNRKEKRRMKPIRILAIALTILLLVSVFSAAFIIKANSSLTPPESEPIAIDDCVKDVTIDSQMPAPLEGASSYYSANAKTPYWNLGDSAIWLIYGSGYPSAFTYFTLGYIGTSVEIWLKTASNIPLVTLETGYL